MSGDALEAVFFDIGNVLLHFNPTEVLQEVAGAVGRHPLKVAEYLWTSRKIEALERGELGTEELYRIFREELGFTGDLARFKTVWCDHFRLERRTAAILKKVAKRVPAYLLSNTHALHYEFIRENYAFPRHVRGAVLSHELGMRKPEARIYAAALKIAGVSRPGAALLIDDLELNVAAALKAGFQAIRYRGPEDLFRRLQALGVLV
ncbi:MAG: HAD family phosphatase [Elusimicrobia bacterium]|nr:HAD family phosphatase [Elusimicrobiota bacterium]